MDTANPPPHQAFVDIVGPPYALTEPVDMESYLREPRGLFHHPAALVLKPGSVGEVQRIVKLAAATGTALIPQGGNTGLVGGQVPIADSPGIIVSLGRLNAIREVDTQANHIVAEAGVTLAALQEAAAAADRLYPLTLASEGSCQVGGNISTNAGGTAVLAYGNTRELVLGLEVVLADGRVWNGLRALHKDNTGYDLKQAFIGAEGTLGIITAAVLRLLPRPRGRAVAVGGLASPADALALLTIARELAAGQLTACELMPRIAIDMVLRHAPGSRDPLSGSHPWYVLVEISSNRSDEDAGAALQRIFERGLESGLVNDAVLAESMSQADALWRIRHALSEVQRHEGGSIKHDVAVPVAAVPELIARASAAVEARLAGIRPVPFGHLGDGNVHFNCSQPVGMDKQAFLTLWDEVNEIVHDIVRELGGTISAEHGIGQLKRHLLPQVKDDVEMDLMRASKKAFDPHNLFNPGKIL
ncbi:MAG: FAD-binding oxidoreductase [Alphaproteobacteria bacterium]